MTIESADTPDCASTSGEGASRQMEYHGRNAALSSDRSSAQLSRARALRSDATTLLTYPSSAECRCWQASSLRRCCRFSRPLALTSDRDVWSGVRPMDGNLFFSSGPSTESRRDDAAPGRLVQRHSLCATVSS